MMSKKHFIALANVMRSVKYDSEHDGPEYAIAPKAFKRMVDRLANFCADQNPDFNRERWLSYLAGECGPSGGKLS